MQMAVRSRFDSLREHGRSAAAIPALIMIAVFVWLGAAEGGYFETTFLPAALLALALLVTALVSISASTHMPRIVLVAAGLFAAYAAWSYLSILWAGDQGAAWEGANRALMYALVFALFALPPISARAGVVIVGAFGLGIAGLGVVTLLRATAAADVSDMFINGRFAEPVGYTNGNAALWFSGFLPCIYIAARRESWPPIRGLALGGASLLAGLSLLTQSRGWLAAIPVTLALFLAFVPGRVRHGVALVAVAAAVVASLDPLLAVLENAREGSALEPLIDSAGSAILIASAVLALVTTAVAFADRAVDVGGVAARRARAVTASVLVVGLLAAGVGLVVAAEDPVGAASEAWEEFKTGREPTEGAGSRFTSAGGQNRYDYWTVALDQFAESPIIGDGTGNFQNAYLRDGESKQRPRFPHSLEVRLLSETGLVGALLFLGGAAAALLLALSAVRRRSMTAASAAGTAAVTFLYWVVHGSVDWFYELPALAAPAFALLGVAAALAPRRRADRAPRAASRPPVSGWLPVAGLSAAAIAAAAALALPWLSQLQVDAAIETWPDDPPTAFERLDRAASLNPLSIEPHTTAAAIALRLEQPDTARTAFEAVLARDPDDTYATLQLAAIASSEGGSREAVSRMLERANELSPRDALVDAALERARAGDRLDPVAIYDAALERRSSLTDAR
jgi:O-antigen ligase